MTNHKSNMLIEGHKILFKTITGSHAFGTNIDTSDEDIKGIFLQNPEDIYVNGYKEELRIDKDEMYWELEKFLLLCSNGNPNALEILYCPENCILYMDNIFLKIIEIRQIFLTKNLRHGYANYAYNQIKKSDGLDKMMNWEKDKTIRKSVIDMCYIYEFKNTFHKKATKIIEWFNSNKLSIEHSGLVKIEHFKDCYLLFYNDKMKYKGIISSEDANDVCVSEINLNDRPIGILFFHKDAYSTHCKDYRNYQDWLAKRNTQRYIDVANHGQMIDGKNILHCVRIIETAMEIPVDKTINVYRKNKDYLIDIRRGKYDLITLQNKAEEDIKKMDELFKNSDLPEKFEYKDLIKDLIKKIKIKFFHENK